MERLVVVSEYELQRSSMVKILKKSFYNRDTALVAQELLGKIIVRIIDQDTPLKGRIVETEAYIGSWDKACHAHKGKRVANAPLFGPVGHAYVYFIYGMYYCLNFVSRTTQEPSGGVLIRAMEPIDGLEYMQHKRHTTKLHNLTSGPGKLTKALSITTVQNGVNLMQQGELYVLDAPKIDPKNIVVTTRVGISKAADEKLRFYIKDNPFVSKK